MSKQSSLEDLLFDNFSPLFPAQKFFFYQEGVTEPKGTYCSCEIIEFDMLGQEANTAVGVQSEDPLEPEVYRTSVTRHYRIQVRFRTVGDEAEEFIERIENLITETVSREFLSYNGLGVLRKNNIQRTPMRRDTQYVKCFTYVVEFSAYTQHQYETDVVENIEGIVPSLYP